LCFCSAISPVCLIFCVSSPASGAPRAANTLSFGGSLVLGLRSLCALQFPVWLLVEASGLILFCHCYSPAYIHLVQLSTAARLASTPVFVSSLPIVWTVHLFHHILSSVCCLSINLLIHILHLSPPSETRDRWKTLQDYFVKNRKKNLPTGSAGGSQKEWKYAEIMSFLLPHIQPRRSVWIFLTFAILLTL